MLQSSTQLPLQNKALLQRVSQSPAKTALLNPAIQVTQDFVDIKFGIIEPKEKVEKTSETTVDSKKPSFIKRAWIKVTDFFGRIGDLIRKFRGWLRAIFAGEKKLLKNANKIKTKWAKQMGLNPKRLAEIKFDRYRLLPSIAFGAYFPTFGKLIIKKPVGLLPPEELVPHELFHSYCGNLRKSWAQQFPEEVKKAKIKIMEDEIDNDKGKTILRLEFKRDNAIDKIRNTLFKTIRRRNSSLIPENSEKFKTFITDVLLRSQEFIIKPNEKSKLVLSKSAQEYGKALGLNKSTINTVESNLNDYIKFTEDLQRISKKHAKKIKLLKFSEFSDSDKKNIKNVFQLIIENREKYTAYNTTLRCYTLNDNGEKLVNQKVNIFRGNDTLKNYFNSLIYRLTLLETTGLLPDYIETNEINTPLSSEEKETATKSFDNWLSTLTGNLLLQVDKTDQDNIFKYTFSWEEFNARKVSNEYMLYDVTNKLNNKPGNKKLEKLKVEIEANLKIITLFEQLGEIEKKAHGRFTGQSFSRISALEFGWMYNDLKNDFDSTEADSKKKELVEKIYNGVNKCTLNPLPRFMFRTGDDYKKYQKRLVSKLTTLQFIRIASAEIKAASKKAAA